MIARLAMVLSIFLLVEASCLENRELTLNEQAQAIDRSLICPVCPGETIDQSQVPLAQQMRDMVRQKLGAGESAEEIRQYFVERYGTSVLAEPPKQGFHLVAWIIPPMIVVMGCFLLLLVLKGLRRTPDPMRGSDMLREEELESYLVQVDKELEGEYSPDVSSLPYSGLSDSPANTSHGTTRNR